MEHAESSPLTFIFQRWHLLTSRTAPRHLAVWLHATPLTSLSVLSLTDNEAFETTALANAKWSVGIERGLQMATQKSDRLAELVHWARLQSPAPLFAKLFLPEVVFTNFRLPCRPEWGASDIQAESWLEAAALMQQPMATLAMDYTLAQTAEGGLMAQVWVCERAWIDQALALFGSFGLNLKAIGVHGALAEGQGALPC